MNPRLKHLLRKPPEGVSVRLKGSIVTLTVPTARSFLYKLTAGALLCGVLLVTMSLMLLHPLSGAAAALSLGFVGGWVWRPDRRVQSLDLVVHQVMPLSANWSAARQLHVADGVVEGQVAEWLWRVLEASPVSFRELVANPAPGAVCAWGEHGVDVLLGSHQIVVAPGRVKLDGRWRVIQPDTVWSTTPADGGLWGVWVDEVLLRTDPRHQLFLIRLLRAASRPTVCGEPPEALKRLLLSG